MVIFFIHQAFTFYKNGPFSPFTKDEKKYILMKLDFFTHI